MAAGAHFGCPKFTFDHISGHFRSIRNLLFFHFFYKMAAGGHFGCSKITFDCISGHFRSICHFGYLKFTFDSNSGHFISIQIFFFGGHFGCPKFSFNGIFGHFRSIHNFFFNFLTKWPPAAILDGTTMSNIELVRDIWMSNACVKFEERSLNPSKIIALTTKLYAACILQ